MAAVPNAEALQRLETRAVGAEKMIQMLKAQIAQIQPPLRLLFALSLSQSLALVFQILLSSAQISLSSDVGLCETQEAPAFHAYFRIVCMPNRHP